MMDNLLLSDEEMPYICVSDLFPVNTTERATKLFIRWGENKKAVAKAQNKKTLEGVVKWLDNEELKVKIQSILDQLIAVDNSFREIKKVDQIIQAIKQSLEEVEK